MVQPLNEHNMEEKIIQQGNLLCLSWNVPHISHSIESYMETLEELSPIIAKCKSSSLPVIIAMDANASLENMIDNCYVGPAILNPRAAASLRRLERAGLLHQFLIDNDIYAANTFANGQGEDLATRIDWGPAGALSTGHEQIDFIAFSRGTVCLDVGVDQSMAFNPRLKSTLALRERRIPCL